MLGKLFLCNILAMSSLCAGKDQLPGARLCTSKPGISWDSSDVHVVFIGDSLTRYQFLATTYRIHFQKTIPRSLVNEKMFDSWSDFYRKTTTIFSGSMKCDCFRYERGERKKKFTFSFSRENRFFSFSLHCCTANIVRRRDFYLPSFSILEMSLPCTDASFHLV